MIFISYSRTNEEFVRDLWIALGREGFETWWDRENLRAGDDWAKHLEQAVDTCEVLVVVISEAALESQWVRMEYERALSQGKSVFPVLLENTPNIPEDLQKLHWVDFSTRRPRYQLYNELRRALEAYAELKPNRGNFLVNLLAPRPSPANLNDRYMDGVNALIHGDPFKAEIALQQVVEQDRSFHNGDAARKLAEARERANALRVRSWYQQADEANLAANWGDELKALENLAALTSEHRTEVKKRREIVKANLDATPLYHNARDSLAVGNGQLAIEQLRTVYQNAPFYGDPEGIASRLGLGEKQGYLVQKRAYAAQKSQLEREVREAASLVQNRKNKRLSIETEQNAYRGKIRGIWWSRWIGCVLLLILSPTLAYVGYLGAYVLGYESLAILASAAVGTALLVPVLFWVVTWFNKRSFTRRLKPLSHDLAQVDAELERLNVRLADAQNALQNLRRSGREFESSWWGLW